MFERGWLSSNNILVVSDEHAALVDTGYSTHSAQTVALVRAALRGRSLDTIANTHLHSDHCGGNAALQACYASVSTLVPPGQASHVESWDPVALGYVPTGQVCPRFSMNGQLTPGTVVELGGFAWDVHAAPGHDPDSVVLFEPHSGTLISADALWRNGFGIVFPELDGERAFHEVATTLDLIQRLAPRIVIPGHGPVFADVDAALAAARSRLAAFDSAPKKHAAHAVKVLIKFRLLELQQMSVQDLARWLAGTRCFGQVHQSWFSSLDTREWLDSLLSELERTGAARLRNDIVFNS